jgi:uncharacterized protein YjbI with pentapeptide repeats
MANDEHVALLKQGVAAWNAWRDANANILPDLSGADLSEAILIEANLIEEPWRHPNGRSNGLSTQREAVDITAAMFSRTRRTLRMMVRRDAAGVRLLTRNGHNWSPVKNF